MKFDLLQHDHTFFDLAARHCLWPGRTCPLAEVLSGFSGLCGILQRPSAESSNLVSPGRVHSVARMSLHVHEPWRSYYQEHYHRRPHPPESPPSNDQCSNMNVTSRRASAKERYLPCSTPPHPKHWRTWYKMRTNTPCLWEVHSKMRVFSPTELPTNITGDHQFRKNGWNGWFQQTNSTFVLGFHASFSGVYLPRY